MYDGSIRSTSAYIRAYPAKENPTVQTYKHRDGSTQRCKVDFGAGVSINAQGKIIIKTTGQLGLLDAEQVSQALASAVQYIKDDLS